MSVSAIAAIVLLSGPLVADDEVSTGSAKGLTARDKVSF
jgi:hypothetical protein